MFILKIILAYIGISILLNIILFFPIILQRIKDTLLEERKRKEEWWK